MDDLKKIKFAAERLREARGQRALNEVAATLGITKQRLWNYENGLKDPPSHLLIKLCLLYEKPIEFFSNARAGKKIFVKV